MTVFELESQLLQGKAYRDHLDRNWKAGNDKLAFLENKIENMTPSKPVNVVSQQDINDLNNKINRIILGIDHETIKLVVREILKEEGVI